MQAPVLVLNANAKRETGRKAQYGNIASAKSVADVIRTTLGPRSMLKMILDPMGGIVMTNDGNAILREIDVSHPAAKSMIELSRTQDEEVGDGTTSVIILAAELLSLAQPYIERNIHPRIIVNSYLRALDSAMIMLDRCSIQLDLNNRDQLLSLARSCLGTKFVSRFGDLICNLALDAVLKVTINIPHTASDGTTTYKKEIDIKRYARIEKIPGGYLEDSCVLDGVMLNKDVVHPAMRRYIEHPRILLLDCNLEYKKAESQTNLELKREEDFELVLKQEEEYIYKMCQHIIALKPDIVCVEKGVSDLAAHYLQRANVSVLRRLRKTDNNRIARATGATICSVAEEVKDSDIGTKCGLFQVKKIGDEYFSYLVQCQDAKACTVLLRGASKDVLNEIERNLIDAMNVVRNIVFDPRVVPGGGAVEMALSHYLSQEAKLIQGVQQYPFKAVAAALEIIPKTLIENCGGSAIRALTALRAKHAEWQQQHNNNNNNNNIKALNKNNNPSQQNNTIFPLSPSICCWGIDGNTGDIADMLQLQILDPYAVKSQTMKTAIEAACLLLRIDDIVSGMTTSKGGQQQQQAAAGEGQEEETFGDARDG